MAGYGLSDMARQLSLQLSSQRLKSATNRLTQELSSGKKAQIGAMTSRDMTEVAGLNRSLTLLASLKTSVAETSIFFTAQQTALGNLQDQSETAAAGFLTAGAARHPAQLSALAVDSTNRFESLISVLNTRAAEKSVLSGAATDRPAMASPDTILTALKTEVAGLTTADDIITRLTDWFMTPGDGFDTIAYLGDTTPAGPFPIGQGENLTASVTAAADPIRQAMLGFALGAMLNEPSISASTEERAKLSSAGGELLLNNAADLSDLRAELGISESRIDEGMTRVASASLATEKALADLTNADPYRTATDLQDVMNRLESLNVLTTRISRLSLTEFLR